MTGTILTDMEKWLALTGTDETVQRILRDAVNEDLSGEKPSGLAPYREGDRIVFQKHWIGIIGKKSLHRQSF